jgi:uncharacterized protein YukE
MSSNAIRAEIERLKRCVSDMESLDEWITSLGKKVAKKADSFSGVRVAGSWKGDAADEFQKELDRTRDKVTRSANRASRASRTIGSEIAKTKVEILLKEAQLVLALAEEAAARAVKAAKGANP